MCAPPGLASSTFLFAEVRAMDEHRGGWAMMVMALHGMLGSHVVVMLRCWTGKGMG